MAVHTFTATPWQWEARSEAWVFVSLPEALSDLVDETGRSGGWGAVRVEVVCGGTTWRTSVFPDSTRSCYVLPLKKAVRAAEDVEVGRPVTLAIELVDR